MNSTRQQRLLNEYCTESVPLMTQRTIEQGNEGIKDTGNKIYIEPPLPIRLLKVGERRGCYEVTRPTTDIKQRQELPYPHRALLFKIMMMEAATDLPAAPLAKR